MDLPVDPVRLSVEEILAVLHAGHRAAAVSGPEAAQAFLQRTLIDTVDLPPAARMVIYELLSEAQAELLDWEGCTASLTRAQEERRRALESESSRSFAPARESDGLARTPVADPLPAIPQPDPENPVVSRKHCRSCGKDVTHRSRRKDPISGTYLCNECFGRPERSQGHPGSRRPALWVAALSLLALAVLVLLLLGAGP